MYPQQAYQCTANESDECHSNCMEKISNYFDDPFLARPDESQLNLNALANSPLKSSRVCQDLNKPIGKPGTDIYAQSFAQSVRTSKYTNLGRVCCASPCKCEFVFQYANTNKETGPTPLTVPVVDDVNLNLGFECSDELSDCISYCRKIAFITVDLKDPNYIKKDTTQRTDVFSSLPSLYSQYMCSLIGETLWDDYGFNVYLRYSASLKTPDEFPYREDIHIGRLCCQYFVLFSQWLAGNRCYDAPPLNNLISKYRQTIFDF